MNNKSVSSLSLRKFLLSALVAAPLATLPVPLWALPSVGAGNLSSSAGSSTTVSASSTTININTPDRTVLTWGTLDTASGETINYTLPSSSAAVLNRVTGGATTINGLMWSNGKIFVINAAGITVGATGNITASGVALSTVNESDFNFNALGTLSYLGTPTADVSTLGGAVIKVGQSGNVALVGKNVNVAGTIDAGTLTVTSNNTGAVTLGGAAVTTLGGTTSGGTNYGAVSVATNGGAANLVSGAANVVINGGNLTVTTSGGAVTGAGGGALAVGDASNAGVLTINTASGGGNGTVTLPATNGNGKQLNVTLTSGDANIVDASGDIQLNASTVKGALTIGATTGNILSGGAVASTTGVTLSAATADKTITFVGSGNLTVSAVTSNTSSKNAVTITSTSGNVSVPAITTTALNLNAASNIDQTGALIVSGTTAVNATSGNVTLNNAGNNFGTVVVTGTPGANGAQFTDLDSVILGKGTNAAGNVAISAATGIQIGAASGDAITVAGKLGLTVTAGAGTTISQSSDNTTINGALNLSPGATHNATIAGSNGKALGLKNQYGQVNVANGANVTIFEQTSLNLGNVAISGNLNAYSASAILNSGQLIIGGTTTVGAGSASAPGAINLDYTNSTAGSGNQLTGNIMIQTDLGLLGAGTGNYLASSVTIVNENATHLTIPANLYGTGLTGDVSITEATTNGIDSAAGPIIITGNLWLTAKTGAINLSDTTNQFSTANVTSAGDVTLLTAATAYTLNATLKEASGGGKVANFSTQGNKAITLGSFASNYTGAAGVTFNTGTGAITDSVSGISIYGPVSFTAGSLGITKSGHSFGGVTINTSGNNGNATIVESGTLKLVSVQTGTGAFNATSQNGSIIEDAAGAGIVTGSKAATTAWAGSGVVTLDLAAANNFGGPVSVTASGNSTVVSNLSSIQLGNATVSSGTFTADASGFAGGAISEATGATVNVYGATTFKGNGAGTINVSNSGNKFGGLTLTTGTGAITIKEMTTMNLQSVTTTGGLTATSEGGSIVDSGSGAINGGAASLTANNDIVLGLTGSAYPSLALKAGGNVSIVDPSAAISLGASTIGGTFTLTASNAGAAITQTGALLITGDTTVTASGGTSSIGLTNSGNQFGALKFTVGSGGATINEATTMNLKAGTIATGSVVLSTGGNFITSGSGASTFLGPTTGLSISAPTGTIIPGAGSLLVINGLTVYSNNAIDLSGLSKSGNLNNINPTHLGTGAYSGPGN